MDMMFWMELAVVIIAIFIGAKWGGAGLGAAGGIGLGVLVFGFGMQPGAPPVSVLLIITAVITCASILQGSGGLDFLVSIAEKLLRRNPKNITFMGPLVCYLFTLFCGTAYVAFSVYPVIAEVAIGARVRPERPLTMSVIGAQSGITGSPMSAATGAMIALLAVKGVTPLQIFSVAIPACLLGVLIGCAFMFKKGKELADDPEFQRRVMSGEFQDKPINTDSRNYSSSAKKGVIVFALGILAVVFFGSFPDLMPSWEKAGKVTRLSIPNMVQIVMLCCAGLIMVIANVSPKKLADGSVFRSGLIGMVAVYGYFLQFLQTDVCCRVRKHDPGRTNPFCGCLVYFVSSALLSGRNRNGISSDGYRPRNLSGRLSLDVPGCQRLLHDSCGRCHHRLRSL